MLWARRLLLLGAVSLGAALALGYGFDDGGEETGFAAAMTDLAAVLYVIPLLALLFALPLALLLFLAARTPSIRSFFDQPLQWVLLGLLFSVWLVVVPAYAWFAGWSDGGGLEGPCTYGSWVRDVREQVADQGSGATVSVHDEGWLSTRCVVDGPNGHAEKVFPEPRTWIGMLILMLLPALLWPLARRVVARQQLRQAI